MKIDQNLIYLCDGKACNHEPKDCYVFGGACKHTSKFAHAKNKGGTFNKFKREGEFIVEQE